MRPWDGLYQTGRGQWAEGPEDLRRGHRSAHCAGHSCALDTQSKWQCLGDGTRDRDSWIGRLEGLGAGGGGSMLGLPVPCQEGDTGAELEVTVLGRGCLAGDTAQHPRPHGTGEGPAVKQV